MKGVWGLRCLVEIEQLGRRSSQHVLSRVSNLSYFIFPIQQHRKENKFRQIFNRTTCCGLQLHSSTSIAQVQALLGEIPSRAAKAHLVVCITHDVCSLGSLVCAVASSDECE